LPRLSSEKKTEEENKAEKACESAVWLIRRRIKTVSVTSTADSDRQTDCVESLFAIYELGRRKASKKIFSQIESKKSSWPELKNLSSYLTSSRTMGYWANFISLQQPLISYPILSIPPQKPKSRPYCGTGNPKAGITVHF